jgi:hypothetical protein
MADADTTRSQLAFREEAAFNEAIPGTPTLQILRITKHSIAHKNNTIVSNELRADRARSDLLLVGQEVTGGFSFEFSSDTFDKFLESSLGGAFTVGVLKSGVAGLRSFQFEDQALDIAQFLYFRGCSVNDLNLNISSKQIVTGDVSFMGTIGRIASATAATTTVAATVTPVMAAGINIASVLVNGAAIGIGVKDIKLSIKNNLRARDDVASLVSRKYGRGDLDITGTIQAYFADASIWSLFVANTALSLSFVLTDGVTGGKSYTVLLPRIKLPDDMPDLSGMNADRMENIQFRALLDPTEACQMKVTKATL